MSNLKPCPFCGSQPKGPTKTGGGDERNGYNFRMVIACECGAAIQRASREGKGGWCDDTGQALAAVIEAWNRRAADQPAAALSPRGNPCLNDPCLRAKDGSECFPCDHADAASTNSPEVSSGLVGSSLPEFWQLAKNDDGRAVVYVTEEQWNVLRCCWIPDTADNSGAAT